MTESAIWTGALVTVATIERVKSRDVGTLHDVGFAAGVLALSRGRAEWSMPEITFERWRHPRGRADGITAPPILANLARR